MKPKKTAALEKLSKQSRAQTVRNALADISDLDNHLEQAIDAMLRTKHTLVTMLVELENEEN